ncbi:SLC13 family permease [Rhodothalassium salexigens]|uniref:SLC13 family permease n=1 Tax=Rhodothalassium salexigens TaxID=1086 RepID=UPI001911DF90|nr:SLC13 family permease [Rhodothalassium salexigens]
MPAMTKGEDRAGGGSPLPSSEGRQPDRTETAPPPRRAGYQRVGLWLGPLLAGLVLASPPPAGLSDAGWTVVAIAALMASWWATEAIPVPATSLIPLIAFPMTGVLSATDAAAPYAHPVIFLLMGGFIMAMGMERWGLHTRIALHVVMGFGRSPNGLILGFMVAAALLSMWISNTATTLMMIPIALSVAETVLGRDRLHDHRFTLCLLLGVAWAASIGGLGTIIGTPPNAFVVSFVADETGRQIAFIEWMAFGVPVVAALVPAAWLVLTRLTYRFDPTTVAGGREAVRDRLTALGAITRPERRTAAVFVVVANLWLWLLLLKKLPGLENLSNMVIAILGALAMFLIPAGDRARPDERLLDWHSAARLPWGVLLLFGGGLSLAAAIKASGLSVWVGAGLADLAVLPLLVVVVAVVALIIFLTEMTSNTATVAAVVPILGAMAGAGGFDPLYLAAPAAMAGSAAFMLPVATAPNAIIFASGHVSIPQMVRAGFRLNLISIVLISGLCTALVPLLFG